MNPTKILTLISLSFLLIALTSASTPVFGQGADPGLRPPIKDGADKDADVKHTSPSSVLSGNPIKLNVSKDDLSSDLPSLDEPLSLKDAVKVGLKNNLDYLASEQEWSGSKYLARAALARFGPRASFSVFYADSSINQMLRPMDGIVNPAPMQPIVSGNSLHLLFAGYQPIFTGGNLMGGYRAARAIEKQSLATYQSDRIKAALKVKESYWKAAYDLAKLQVDEDYVKYRKWSVSLVKARYKAGKVPRADLLREEAELSKAQQLVNEGYREYNTSLLDLKVAMGVSIGSQLSLSDQLVFEKVQSTYENYLKEAKLARPEIMQADEKVKETRARFMQIRSKYSPQLGLFGVASNATGRTPGISGNVNGQWGGTVAVQGAITLFDSGERFNELRSARRQVRKAEIDRRSVHLNVAKEVSQGWIDVDIAERNVGLARTEVESAREDERLLSKRYEVGKAIELDYFQSGVKYFEARLRLLESIYQYRLAEAKLVWASGNV
ncbi:MAG: TolC family protein [Candidatus Obscuribacterales bacterium]|nr:TolC family protein [Cyanobacteria bacterium HKST-UBA01]MCB9467999.1 TolC family protein [Candidatus Obscuribacterales bacterium]